MSTGQVAVVPNERSSNMTSTAVHAGLYCRLSVEDDTPSESGSIQTQKAMLTDYCQQNGFHIVDYYVDDGETGTNFERPSFQRMLSDIESRRINTVICKDLSRFGRNYYEAGMYLDKYFVERNVRFIAIADNVDSARGGNELNVPLLNIMNDHYAREISQKTKAAKQARAKRGLFLGSKAPYGYRKDPEDRHHLVVDPEAASIVRWIFNLAEDGYGFQRIARVMMDNNVPNPKSYAEERNPPDTRWHLTSVQKILQNPVYHGDCVQGRRGNRIMHGKQIPKPEDEWIVVKGTHEPLILDEQWDVVQKQLRSRKRSTKDGEPQMFAGLMFCSECGSALSFSVRHRKNRPDGGDFKCWKYMRYGKEYCTSHYITLDQISEVILEDIRRQARYAKYCRTGYIELLREQQELRNEEELLSQKQAAEQAKQRLPQIDAILRKLLEQNAAGVISDERFATMVKDYEREQAELKAAIQDYENAVKSNREANRNIEQHVRLIEQYTDIRELNAKILNRLIEKIVIHQRQTDADGCLTQMIEIYYRFVGKVEIDLLDVLIPGA